MSRGDVTQLPQSINTQGQEKMPGVVVSVDDPEMKGRVKVRSMASKNIPDDKLPWVYAAKGGNQSYGGMGSSAHAYKPGMMVNMSVPYADQQSAEILGPYHQPGGKSQGGTGQQLYQSPWTGVSKSAEGGGGGQQGSHWKKRHKESKTPAMENLGGSGTMAGGFDQNPTPDWETKKDYVENFYKPEGGSKTNQPAKFAHLPTIAFEDNNNA